jgi:hypothetical protein
MEWTGEESEDYSHCFLVNLASLRQVSFTVQQLATALGVPIEPSQGWTILPDGAEPEWAVNTLAEGPGVAVEQE